MMKKWSLHNRSRLTLTLSLLLGYAATVTSQTLVERLGYPKNAILLIVNNDDAGMCHAANTGTIKGLQEGLISSSTIMFTCPWATEIVDFAKTHPDKDFGVHLTLTSEWKHYKWGPVAPIDRVRSLVDSNGYFWKGVQEVYQHGNAEQAYEEGKAQIEKALSYGLPITHIDSHMGTFQLDPAYFEQYARLAKTFNLPLRMASQSTLEKYGQGGMREKCIQLGLVFPDYLIYEELQNYGEVEDFWVNIIDNLKPGVTELYLHASELTPELEAITGTARKRADELKAFTESSKIREALARKNVQLISYRPLLELQRASNP
ncbi:polysaccharide deacetylase family protein [Parapedobacter defluvii]|nr:polysaccharide deacetylase family protein [Parapedobacter defluvii]